MNECKNLCESYYWINFIIIAIIIEMNIKYIFSVYFFMNTTLEKSLFLSKSYFLTLKRVITYYIYKL
jgi:hypothetical protein